MTGFYMKCIIAQKCPIAVSNNKIARKCVKSGDII